MRYEVCVFGFVVVVYFSIFYEFFVDYVKGIIEVGDDDE